MSEIIFEVSEDEVDGGYSANALGYGIHTEGETLEELRQNVKEAVECYFDETMERPGLIRLHFVRDEIKSNAGEFGLLSTAKGHLCVGKR